MRKCWKDNWVSLEQAGPDGEDYAPPSNRAKLQAVIAALDFRPWAEERGRSIVILTNLKYIVDGPTGFVSRWVEIGWRGRRSKPAANRDLWEELHGIIEDLERQGTRVRFWFMRPKSLIQQSESVREAKCAAQETARWQDVIAAEFSRLCGMDI